MPARILMAIVGGAIAAIALVIALVNTFRGTPQSDNLTKGSHGQEVAASADRDPGERIAIANEPATASAANSDSSSPFQLPPGPASGSGTATTEQADAGLPDWRVLFDGKDLVNWRSLGGYRCLQWQINGNWDVRNGVIAGTASGGDSIAVLATREQWRDFELQLEYRFQQYSTGACDCGICLFGRTAGDRDWRWVELSLVPGDPNSNWKSGSLQGTVQPLARPQIDEAWNSLRIRFRNPRLEAWINDELIQSVDVTAALPGHEVVHSISEHPILLKVIAGTAMFRNVRIRSLGVSEASSLSLPPTPPAVTQSVAPAGAAAAGASAAQRPVSKPEDRDPDSLLAGKSLAEFSIVSPGAWEIVDDELWASAGGSGRIQLSADSYKSYELRCQVCCLRNARGGLLFGFEDAAGQTGTMRPLYEISLVASRGFGDPLATGGLVFPSTSRASILPAVLLASENVWVDVSVQVIAGRIRCYVNRKLTLDYRTASPPQAGPIALQCRTGQMGIRNLQIRGLPDDHDGDQLKSSELSWFHVADNASWTLQEGILEGVGGVNTQLTLPDAMEHFELTCEVSTESRTRAHVAFGADSGSESGAGSRGRMLICGANAAGPEEYSGMLGGLAGTDNRATAKPPAISDNEWTTVRLRVANDRIQSTIGRTRSVDMRLTGQPGSGLISFVVDEGRLRVRNLKVRPLPEVQGEQLSLPGESRVASLRWLSCSIHDPRLLDRVSDQINLVEDGTWHKYGDTLLTRARELRLPVVMEISKQHLERDRTRLRNLIMANRDVVVGVDLVAPAAKEGGMTAEEIEQFGQDLKDEFPGLSFWLSHTEHLVEVAPLLATAPPAVDVLNVSIYYDMSPKAVSDKCAKYLPAWIRLADKRFVALRWCTRPPNWQSGAGGMKAEPGTILACAEVARLSHLQGLTLYSLGTQYEDFCPGLETSGEAMQELQTIADKGGFHRERLRDLQQRNASPSATGGQ